jgi:hypothetical protein
MPLLEKANGQFVLQLAFDYSKAKSARSAARAHTLCFTLSAYRERLDL